MSRKDDPNYLVKRRATGVKNMREWMKGTVYTHGEVKRLDALDTMTVDEIVTVMRIFNQSEDGINAVLKFCRRFKQSAGELQAEDVREALRLARNDVTTSEVMES